MLAVNAQRLALVRAVVKAKSVFPLSLVIIVPL
jgi:hypothetical protein